MEAKNKEIPLLTREEERHLLKNKNDPEAHKKLVDANMRFVLKMAELYKCKGIKMSVHVEAGKKGLIKAIEKFDCEKNKDIKFIAYAVWWVVEHIHHERKWGRARVVK